MGSTANVLDYSEIKSEVQNLCEATRNLLERDPHPALDAVPRAKLLMSALFKVAVNTFETTIFLCLDDRIGRPAFVVACPPLVRSLVDIVCAIVFLFEDLPKNVSWFWLSGWHRAHEQFTRWEQQHGADPEWADHLAPHRDLIEQKRLTLEIPKGSTVRKGDYWPHPGKMIGLAKDPERSAFLHHIRDWFYGPLSSSTHHSSPGLETSYALLAAQEELDDFQERFDRFGFDQAMSALTVLLAIMSELQIELDLGLAPRLAYLWRLVGEYGWATQWLYAMRYQARLVPQH